MPPIRLRGPPMRWVRAPHRSLHAGTSLRSGSPLFNIAGLATSRESQFFSKERQIPRVEFSPAVQLIRSSEVDPFAPAPGASPEAVRRLHRVRGATTAAIGGVDARLALAVGQGPVRGSSEESNGVGTMRGELLALRTEIQDLRVRVGRAESAGQVAWALLGAAIACALLVPLQSEDLKRRAASLVERLRATSAADRPWPRAVDPPTPVTAAVVPAPIRDIEVIPSLQEPPIPKTTWNQQLSRLLWSSRGQG